MTELEQIWRSKTDAQVQTAAKRPQDYKPEARAVILAEYQRRQLDMREAERDVSAFQFYAESLELASRGDRISAQLVDSLIAFAPLLIPFGLSYFSDLLATISLVPAILFLLWYLLFADGMRGGQSWAKRGIGMAVVVLSTGKPCSYWRSFVRNFPLIFLGTLDWMFIFGRTRRRFGDFLAGTIVIKRSDPD
jgi:uncharacterized RDD family membrane protein YckC